MPQQEINIGNDPGNLGDGDTLRDAFKKTQDNFDELYVAEYVNDTSISDHADPSTSGSIAHALELVSSKGGGAVIIGPGTYDCFDRLTIGRNVRLVGTARGATIIHGQHDLDIISISSGTFGLQALTAIEHLTLQISSGSAASAISAESSMSGVGHIKHVQIVGGSPSSWGISLDGSNEFLLLGITIDSQGSGIRWTNALNRTINYGDSLVSGVDISLRNSGTTGIALIGNTNGIINNILLSRVEVKGNGGLPGTVGIELNKASRISLINIDIENLDTAVINGPSTNACTFINTYAINCTTDYLERIPASRVTIIGGYGDFANDQRLPSRNLRLYAPNFSDYTTVRTGIQDIERYADIANPRVLSLADSGSTLMTNGDALGPVTFILPEPAFSKSIEFTFVVLEPFELRIVPASNNDLIWGYDGTLTATSNGVSIFSSVPGTTGTLCSIGSNKWFMKNRLGEWTFGV
jgi:hypothetical protein